MQEINTYSLFERVFYSVGFIDVVPLPERQVEQQSRGIKTRKSQQQGKG